MRCHSSSSIDGKIFCCFIALIAATYMSEKLRIFNDLGGHRRLSKINLIKEFEKIKVIVRGEKRRLLNPITKLQRELLSGFGIAENELESFAKDAKLNTLYIGKSLEI